MLIQLTHQTLSRMVSVWVIMFYVSYPRCSWGLLIGVDEQDRAARFLKGNLFFLPLKMIGLWWLLDLFSFVFWGLLSLSSAASFSSASLKVTWYSGGSTSSGTQWYKLSSNTGGELVMWVLSRSVMIDSKAGEPWTTSLKQSSSWRRMKSFLGTPSSPVFCTNYKQKKCESKSVKFS